MRGINLHPSVKIKAASECYFKCCLAFCFNPVSIAWYKLQNQNYL